MIVDSHVHFWRLARGDNTALSPEMKSIYADREPAHLKPLMDTVGVNRAVAVQAAETLAENFYTIGLSRRYGWISGVIGWIDPTSPSLPEEIDTLSGISVVKGVRPVRDDNRSVQWMLSPEAMKGIGELESSGLVLDMLVQNPDEIPVADRIARTFPALSLVLNHCGKPDIRQDRRAVWERDIRRLASNRNVTCKLSGLMNCAPPGATADVIRSYSDTVLDQFGPDRIMWASDWPSLDLASSYDSWRQVCRELLKDISHDDRAAIYGRTATRVYRLDAVGGDTFETEFATP
ncbi:MAG: amidohydrolase family protein [Rhodobacteraceae bacterium]|nr:amidohydrolase family protein [Paracoccaceae bacterium]